MFHNHELIAEDNIDLQNLYKSRAQDCINILRAHGLLDGVQGTINKKILVNNWQHAGSIHISLFYLDSIGLLSNGQAQNNLGLILQKANRLDEICWPLKYLSEDTDIFKNPEKAQSNFILLIDNASMYLRICIQRLAKVGLLSGKHAQKNYHNLIQILQPKPLDECANGLNIKKTIENFLDLKLLKGPNAQRNFNIITKFPCNAIAISEIFIKLNTANLLSNESGNANIQKIIAYRDFADEILLRMPALPLTQEKLDAIFVCIDGRLAAEKEAFLLSQASIEFFVKGKRADVKNLYKEINSYNPSVRRK
jgi:hypothetical protein